ncbi:MAG TPA: enolase C-terminal domain-like protein [Stellaceae bacterium]
MALRSIEVARFPTAFRHAFAHASATRTAAENVIVAAISDRGVVGYGEGCPRDYVTGETIAGARSFLASVAADIAGAATGVEALKAWIAARTGEIDRNPAAFAALEMALLDMMGRERGVSVEKLLGLPPLAPLHRYSAVIGDSAPLISRALWLRYRLSGLRDFKVKLSGDARRDRARLAPFRCFGGRLRLDANNLWRSPQDCIAYLRALTAPAFAVEEPLAAHDIEGCRAVAMATGLAIILDETFLSADALTALPRGARWIVNARVSKLGGILRSLAAVQAARQRGLGIIVGAHVGETGLLTRAALPVARAAGDALVAQEGAFGTYLLARDLVAPSPRFGYRGHCPARRLPPPESAGLGLSVDSAPLVDVARLDVEARFA